jgi:hypothetical protein
MRQHIMPTWRTVPLAKITFEGITHWISRLSLGGLGPSAIRQSVFVMSAALDHAVRSGRIRSNPARVWACPGRSAAITSTSLTARSSRSPPKPDGGVC